MNERIAQAVRELAARRVSAEKQALAAYRRHDAEKAEYWDGTAEALGEAIELINRVLMED